MTIKLLDWHDLASRHEWPTLLLGNGFSTNLWRAFCYQQLFAEAQLAGPEQKLFARMKSTDFEEVLDALTTSITVNRALGIEITELSRAKRAIRKGLFTAVRQIHPPHRSLIGPAHPHEIAKLLTKYKQIFTLNYDLIPYWSLATIRDRYDVNDFFPSPDRLFNPDSAREGTTIYFLHGALHLWHDAVSETTGKLTSAGRKDNDLLKQIRQNGARHERRQPLLVSEGSAAQKQRRIRASDYLRFAHQNLRKNEQPLVIFGASLAAQDVHIVNALKAKPNRPLAVSIYRGTPNWRRSADRLAKVFDGFDLHFFDSASHPLGNPELNCDAKI